MSQTAHLTMTENLSPIFPACQWHTEGAPFTQTQRSYDNIGGIRSAGADKDTDSLLRRGVWPEAEFEIQLIACSPAKYEARPTAYVDEEGERSPAYQSIGEDITATILVKQTFLKHDFEAEVVEFAPRWHVSVKEVEQSDFSSFEGEDGLAQATTHHEWLGERTGQLMGFCEALGCNLNNTTEGSTPTLARYAIQDCIVDAMKNELDFAPWEWDAHAGLTLEDEYEEDMFGIVWPDPDGEHYRSTNDGFRNWDSTMDGLDKCLETWEQDSKDYAALAGDEELLKGVVDYLAPCIKDARAMVLRTAKGRGCGGTAYLTPLGELRGEVWVEASKDEDGNDVPAHLDEEGLADLLGGGGYSSGKRATSCSGLFFEGKSGTWNEWGKKPFGNLKVYLRVNHVIGMTVSGEIEEWDSDVLGGIRYLLGRMSLAELRGFCDEGDVDGIIASLKAEQEVEV